MWKDLLRIYRESCLNRGKPECMFAETLIFSEGWLLRSVLSEWKTMARGCRADFLPFPPDVSVYSEGQLRTPFKARFRKDPLAESHTRVDGVVGHFSIEGTKSGIDLGPGLSYLAVFEAKLYSRIAKGTKNAPDYDQVSRTAACLINCVLQVGPSPDLAAHVVVLYPADNLHICPARYSKNHIKGQIARRLETYGESVNEVEPLVRFTRGWERELSRLQLHFVTWEEVLAEIGDDGLNRFYELCKRFNR